MLDAGVLLLAFLGAYAGAKIGVVSAFFNILAGVAGSWIASRLYAHLLPALPPFLAYFSVFAAAAVLLVAAGIFMSQALERFFFDIWDKALGMILGIAFGLTLCAAMMFPAVLAQKPGSEKVFQAAAFAPYLMRTTQKHLKLTPPAVWDRIEPLLESEDVRRVRRLLEGD